jgi:hypothetical protein
VTGVLSFDFDFGFLSSRIAHDLVVFFGHGYALVAPLLLLVDFRASSKVYMSFYGVNLINITLHAYAPTSSPQFVW